MLCFSRPTAEGTVQRRSPDLFQPVESAVTYADRLLFRCRLTTLCWLVFAVAALQNGIWIVPTIKVICHLSSDVTRQMTPDMPGEDYHYTSFLSLLVGYLTGASQSATAFAATQLVILWMGLVCLVWTARRKHGDATARLLLLAFSTVPLSNVLLTWLGMSDVYVFLFSTALVLVDELPLLAVFAFLLGLAHFEQALVIVAGLMIWRFYQFTRAGGSWFAAVAQGAAMLGGVLAARCSLDIYFAARDFHLKTTRASFIQDHTWSYFLEPGLRHLGTLMFSLHGCYWLVMAAALRSLWSAQRRLALLLIILQVGYFGLTLVTIDETRVFSLLAWPLIVITLRPDVLEPASLRRYAVTAFLLGLIVPKFVVWWGVIHTGTLFYDLRLLIGHDLPAPEHLADPEWLSLPFK